MPLVRKSTAAVTPNLKTDDVLQALTRGTVDERWSAARAAAQLDGGAEALGSALRSESDPKVREAMFTSLTRIGTSQSVDALVPLLRSDDAGVRGGALDALHAMPDAVRERLPTLLADADGDVRLLSCEMVRSLPSHEATQLLCDLLAREQETNVCGAAVEVLAEVGDSTALPVLAECAARFQGTPFLAFAIKLATDRIHSQSRNPAKDDPAEPHV